ncbi:MAG: hypothetical protein DMF53_01130 [Acidobacteria bacterium]|nr:MAG: hypothetical protein DMF53_01130 [Acidobacteriota bacterium]
MKTALISFLAANLIRGLRATVRLRFHGDERVREWERTETRFILAFWHRHLLLMPYAYQGKRISVLISQSRDGELIARTVARLGIDSSRGSSSRGGIAGMRSLLRKAAEGWDIAFTPDGPRGPLREVQPGVILAAAATGLPIQPVAIAASRAKLLRSWDRFLVPLPFSKVHIVYGEPLTVERRGDLGVATAELKRRLDGAAAAAEALAGSVVGSTQAKGEGDGDSGADSR